MEPIHIRPSGNNPHLSTLGLLETIPLRYLLCFLFFPHHLCFQFHLPRHVCFRELPHLSVTYPPTHYLTLSVLPHYIIYAFSTRPIFQFPFLQPYHQYRLCFQEPPIKPLCYLSTIQPSQLFTRCRRTARGSYSCPLRSYLC
jgi:hypothetical protein